MLKKTIIGIFCLGVFANATDKITLLTHSSQGEIHLNKNHQLRGIKHSGKRAFYVEVVYNMLKEMKQPYKLTNLPFKRGFKMVTLKNNIAFFNVSRTPQREKLVKWVGPISDETDYFYELKSNPTKIKTLNDAKKVSKICVLNGGVDEATLKREGFKNLYSGNTYNTCLKMLQAHRVQLVVSAKNSINTKLDKVHINHNLILKTPVAVLKSYGYLALSKNISDKVMKKWQKALNKLKSSGGYDKLYKLYYKKR